MKNLTVDLNHETHNRCMTHLGEVRFWEPLTPTMRVFHSATNAQQKEMLAALNTQVAYGLETQKIKTDDDAMLGVMLGLAAVVASLLGHEIDLTPETKHGEIVGFAPNASDRVYVLARDPAEGLVRIRLTGWMIMADGSAKPIPNGTPPGPWVVADEPNARMTRPDGSTANLGLAEIELMKETTGGAR